MQKGSDRASPFGNSQIGQRVTLRIIWHKILPAIWHNLQLLMAAPSIVWRRRSKPRLSQTLASGGLRLEISRAREAIWHRLKDQLAKDHQRNARRQAALNLTRSKRQSAPELASSNTTLHNAKHF